MYIPITRELVSQEDLSVNFVFEDNTEARYVRRPNTDYAIVYLSSHNGCNQACRFCHLTQTGQTRMNPVDSRGFFAQMKEVLSHYKKQTGMVGMEEPVKKIHYNWMARGEPLLNETLCNEWDLINGVASGYAILAGVHDVAFNFSTIIPEDSGVVLRRYADSKRPPTIFYSLYSLRKGFRRRWLPNAMDPVKAMNLLSSYQRYTKTDVVLHWTFIKGENDSEQEVADICNLIRESGVRARFNLVRYNPYSAGQGRESEESVLHERFKQLEEVMLIRGSRIVPRVGFDVSASCGMFVNPKL